MKNRKYQNPGSRKPEQPPGRRLRWARAAGLAVLGGMGLGALVWSLAPDDPYLAPVHPRAVHAEGEHDTTRIVSDISRGVDRAQPHQAASGAQAATPQGDDPPPAGLNTQQWQALKLSLADHPQREAELARISALMAFRSDVARLRELRQGGHATPESQTLARRVQADLPTRLASREIGAAEAQALQAAVLEVLQADASQRAAQLSQWRAGLAAAQPPASVDPREQAFSSGQAALLAAWQAEPAGQRDPAQLQGRIEALRHSLFEAPAAR